MTKRSSSSVTILLILQLALTSLYPCLRLAHPQPATSISPFGGWVELCTSSGVMRIPNPFENQSPRDNRPADQSSQACPVCWLTAGVLLTIAAFLLALIWPRLHGARRPVMRLCFTPRHAFAPFPSRAPPLVL